MTKFDASVFFYMDISPYCFIHPLKGDFIKVLKKRFPDINGGFKIC